MCVTQSRAGHPGVGSVLDTELTSCSSIPLVQVYVPFMLKRAVDMLEASSSLATGGGTAAAAAASSAAAASAVPLLVGYVAIRLGVTFANEARSVAFARLSQSVTAARLKL
jgi:hypothetical protein